MKVKEIGKKIVDGTKKIVKAVTPWIAPMAVVLTISAAWDGFVTSHRNEREIDKLNDRISETNVNISLVPADDQNFDAARKNNDELLEEAMDITEGNEESA